MAAVDVQDEYLIKDITCKICDDVYTDARDLTCGHSFCLSCLQGQHTKECPECIQENIPEKDQLKELQINTEKNKLVRTEVVKRIKNSYLNEKTREKSEANDKSDGKENQKHEGVVCNNCDKKDFSGIRYICGICPNYNLCEDCEDKPKEHKHEKTHLFLKLKRPVSKPIPEGPILTEVAAQMGETMDLERAQHTALEKVGPSTYKKLYSVLCNRHVSRGIINGIRYMCGNCLCYDLCGTCEKRSDIIHDPSHVFVKIKHPVNKVIDDQFTTALLKYHLY